LAIGAIGLSLSSTVPVAAFASGACRSWLVDRMTAGLLLIVVICWRGTTRFTGAVTTVCHTA